MNKRKAIRGAKKALDFMRTPGARLVKLHESTGVVHYLIPGGYYVEPDIVAKIKAHPLVRPGDDGMWPGHDQTWVLG